MHSFLLTFFNQRPLSSECALQRLFLWRNDTCFGQWQDKQTARETILFADWRSVILKTKRSQCKMFYRMTGEKFEYETNLTQMRFAE